MSDPLKRQVGGNHYKNFKIQPIEFFMANNILYAEALIINYVLLYRLKGRQLDLEKAKHLIEILIAEQYKKIEEEEDEDEQYILMDMGEEPENPEQYLLKKNE